MCTDCGPGRPDFKREDGGGYCVRSAVVSAQTPRHNASRPSCHGTTVAAESKGGGFHMRHYEVMVILDPDLAGRAVSPLLENFLSVIREGNGKVEKVDTWGRRRLSYEIKKKPEGIYSVIDLQAEPAVVKELDRQMNLNESVLRTKVLRPETD